MDDWTNLIDPQELKSSQAAAQSNGHSAPGAPHAPAPLVTASEATGAVQAEQAARLQRRTNIRRAVLLMILLVGLLWAIEAVDTITPRVTSDLYGVHPRTAEGLRNIVYAPFLHAGFGHLAANTVPLVVLGLLVLLNGLQPFVIVSLVAALTSGLGVWLLGGANTVHLGASGVIFGYLGFLLAAAWFQRSAAAVIVGVLAALLYGSMLWGVLPGQEGVSWLGHFFGLAGGIVAAYLLRKKPTKAASDSSE